MDQGKMMDFDETGSPRVTSGTFSVTKVTFSVTKVTFFIPDKKPLDKQEKRAIIGSTQQLLCYRT